MDNNNQSTPQATVTNTPPANAPVTPQPIPVPVPTPSGSGSNKILIWFIIGLVLIILVVGGIYFYLSRQQIVTSSPMPAVATQTTPKEVTLEDELNSIDVDNASNNDFAPVDQDLNQL